MWVAMGWHLAQFLLVTVPVTTAGDRPEIKNDADETISSVSLMNATRSSSTDPYIRNGVAVWSTCVAWMNTFPGGIAWMRETATIPGSDKPDITHYGFTEASVPLSEGLIDPSIDRPELCTSKHLDVIRKTETRVPGKPAHAQHHKYLVKNTQEDTFLKLATDMLQNTARTAANADGGKNTFLYGYLMLLSADNVDTPTAKIWHIVQYFGLPTPWQASEDTTDSYDAFNVGRTSSITDGDQWMKLAAAINQKTYPSSIADPDKAVEVQEITERKNQKTATSAQWLSFSEVPVESSSSAIKPDAVENHVTKQKLQKSDDFNWNILQFAGGRNEFPVFKNCRIQNLQVVQEIGNFNLDSSDKVMHLEYAVPGNGNEFEAATKEMLLAGYNKVSAQSDFKYMIILKNWSQWNGQTFFHIYQTFEHATMFEKHQSGSEPGNSDSPLGAWLARRNKAPTHEKWFKQESLVNLGSPNIELDPMPVSQA